MASWIHQTPLYFIISLFLVVEVSSDNYGILSVNSSVGEHEFCLIYYAQIYRLPTEKTANCYKPLGDESASNLCTGEPHHSLLNKNVIIQYEDSCGILDQVYVVQKHGGIGALFVLAQNITIPPINSSRLSNPVSIPVVFIREAVADILEGNASAVCMFSPVSSGLDMSFLVTWIIAMFSVCIGSYWSGIVRFSIYSIETRQISSVTSEDEEIGTLPTTPKEKTFEPSSLSISPFAIALYVVFIVGLLLLLYYFYDYLVYFMIGLFTLLTMISTFCCLNPIAKKILPGLCVLVQCNFLDGVSRSFDYRNLIVLLISFSMPIAWVITRHESFAWILLDILGTMFCIHLLKTFRLPNLKICALLLVLLFFYDIFFVFITPFLTAGKSVMEQVAASGNKEKLPMMFQIPRFQNKLSVCGDDYSILGFGDILVPGLLVSYLRGFDLIKGGTKHAYYIVGCLSYGVGLLITFLCLYLMRTAQPALLHLVPSTLLSTILLGWYRGELRQLWIGFKVPKVAEPKTVEVLANPNVSANSSNVELPSVSDTQDSVQAPIPSADLLNERKHLLN